jgi:hypothetical protein
MNAFALKTRLMIGALFIALKIQTILSVNAFSQKA